MSDERPDFGNEDTAGVDSTSAIEDGQSGSGLKAKVEAKATGENAIHVITDIANISDQAVRDYFVSVSLGKITGHERISVIGHNPVVSASGEDLVYNGGTYVFPTSAVTLDIASSSANDAAAGTGANSVRVEGLDANYDPITEDIALNGVTAVTTTQTFLRINKTFVLTAGSSNYNEGEISVIQTGGSDRLSTIHDTAGLSHDYIYTVPRNKTLLASSLSVNSDSNGLEVEFMLKPFGLAWQVALEIVLGDAQWLYQPRAPFPIPGRTDMKVFVNPASGVKSVTGFAEGILVDDGT